uniref:Very long-chain fatty acid transport protein n=1 Tax=Bursaphelenchus xylophilus TaxID=6326 RepID=A0A1I7SDC3_BURXY
MLKEGVNVHFDISDRWECVKTAGLINCLIKCNICEMGLTSHLVDVAIILVLCVLFFQYENWLAITLICLLFRYFSSDIGKRGLKTLPRDLKGLALLLRVKWTMHQGFKRNKPLHYYFLDHVKQHPNKECVVEVETGRKFTFSQLNGLANKYANAYKKVSNEKQIAIFLENSADFFACWLGLSKLGVITAWINSNLKAEPLAHSIKVAKTDIVLTSTSLLPTLLKTIDSGLLPQNLIIYTIDKPVDNGRSKSIQDLLQDPTEPEPNNDINFQSVLCYIYTSGTTGNPKPAIIKHFRYFFIAMGSGKSFGVTPDERIYITMPMYHSAAGILGIGQVVVLGATAIIRKKFSARNFWTEARDHQCTASQYIGEICRYLLAQPRSKAEREHSIRLMYGNGLRPEIWKEFVERFGIRKIGELYGSTEGNSNIVNINNHIGSCGFFPIYPFLTALYPVRLVKVNPETGELLRDENGLCISCRPGDTGEMVGMIKKNDPLLRFEGYVNKDDTDKKVITDVTRKGDVVFSSGDILYWDQYGYLYFKDRGGDTYRWRGENVSTMEVEGVLQPLMQIQNATVFGVEVNGREGRAGMIGATLNTNVDIQEFVDVAAKRLCDNLAAYAIPVFLRICKEVETTGTFKLKKSALQKDGFDPAKCGADPLFYFDYTAKTYKPLDSDMYNMIQSGQYSKI